MTTATTTEQRGRPADPLKHCASCGTPRGNQRRGWEPVARGDGTLRGWTCSACPRADEPIRRIVTKSGAVRYRAVVDASAPGARQRKQVTRTLATLGEARAEVASIRAEVRKQGSYQAPASESLRSLADRWLASRRGVREITREMYQATLASVLRRLGDREASSLTVTDMENLVTWLSEHGARPTKQHPDGRPLTARSVRAAFVALSQVFDFGVTHKVVTENVTKGIELPRQTEKVGRALEHWQPAEMVTFCKHSDTDEWAAAWRLTLCGMTRADICGLRWSDVSLETGKVSIQQGRVVLQMGGQRSVPDEPKSKQRKRTIDVEQAWPGTIALLRALKARQAADKLRAGSAYRDTDYVLVDNLGSWIRPELYSDRFRRLCKAAGVPVIRLHSVRHSLAFLLHQAGVVPADAAEMLGHRVEVHLSTYLPDSGESGAVRAASKMGAALAEAAAAV